jgi:hypothetical protein
MMKTARQSAEQDKLATPGVQAAGHEEALLDQAVAETFPASDPISPAYEKSLQAVNIGRAEHRWQARLRAAAPTLLVIGVAGIAIFIASNTFLRESLRDTARRWTERH